MAKRVSASKARDQFAEIINQVAYGKHTVLIHRRKKPVAAVIPIDDLKLLEEIEEEIDIREARKARREKGRSIPWEEVKKRLKL
ncbi:MAG TPA: type II toxin-antitoxin system Phd/YefM family antitoxin [Terriglobales bacterium]|nr:type II toxin-antitoxin system Phd/YefM family antitoxin [Terriglobales bacterium]